MKTNNSSLNMLVIVAVVAIVGILVMGYGSLNGESSTATISDEYAIIYSDGDLSGQPLIPVSEKLKDAKTGKPNEKSGSTTTSSDDSSDSEETSTSETTIETETEGVTGEDCPCEGDMNCWC